VVGDGSALALPLLHDGDARPARHGQGPRREPEATSRARACKPRTITVRRGRTGCSRSRAAPIRTQSRAGDIATANDLHLGAKLNPAPSCASHESRRRRARHRRADDRRERRRQHHRATLRRRIDGATRLDLTIYDPRMDLLRSGALTRPGQAVRSGRSSSRRRRGTGSARAAHARRDQRSGSPAAGSAMTRRRARSRSSFRGRARELMRLQTRAIKVSRGQDTRAEFNGTARPPPSRTRTSRSPARSRTGTSARRPASASRSSEPDEEGRTKGFAKGKKLKIKTADADAEQKRESHGRADRGGSAQGGRARDARADHRRDHRVALAATSMGSPTPTPRASFRSSSAPRSGSPRTSSTRAPGSVHGSVTAAHDQTRRAGPARR
jgi:hypothetical protein